MSPVPHECMMNILSILRVPCLTFSCNLAVILLQKLETSAADPDVVRHTTGRDVHARWVA